MEDSYSHYHAGISSSEQTKVPREFNAFAYVVGGKEALFGGKEKEDKLSWSRDHDQLVEIKLKTN